MKIELRNIGIIKKADVLLDGLTVIAGENDTGKSTVGKMMFVLIKTLNDYKNRAYEKRETILLGQIAKILLTVRQNFDSKEFSAFFEEFDFSSFDSEIQRYAKLLANNSDENNRQKLDFFLDGKIELLKKTAKDRFGKHQSYELFLSKIEANFIKIKKHILPTTINFEVLSTFTEYVNSEFFNEIKRKGNEIDGEIKLSVANLQILNIKIVTEDNLGYVENVNEIPRFDNVTFVETPVHLQMNDVINYAVTIGENGDLDRPKIAAHIKDLMNKLKQSQYYFDKPDISIQLEKINKIINGEFSFDSLKNDFLFQKKEVNSDKKYSVRSINTASGIKSFGIIQLLLQANILNERSLLVIDEPETHLHPKWQVEYARLMVELVKNNVSVLIASHSPYMIQALKVFSEQEKIEDKTNFYLSEKLEDGFSEINHANDNMNELFAKLSQPLQNLVWQ